jgi:hypothetical protein
MNLSPNMTVLLSNSMNIGSLYTNLFSIMEAFREKIKMGNAQDYISASIDTCNHFYYKVILESHKVDTNTN